MSTTKQVFNVFLCTEATKNSRRCIEIKPHQKLWQKKIMDFCVTTNLSANGRCCSLTIFISKDWDFVSSYKYSDSPCDPFRFITTLKYHITYPEDLHIIYIVLSPAETKLIGCILHLGRDEIRQLPVIWGFPLSRAVQWFRVSKWTRTPSRS
jgi:hypothetical protein